MPKETWEFVLLCCAVILACMAIKTGLYIVGG